MAVTCARSVFAHAHKRHDDTNPNKLLTASSGSRSSDVRKRRVYCHPRLPYVVFNAITLE